MCRRGEWRQWWTRRRVERVVGCMRARTCHGTSPAQPTTWSLGRAPVHPWSIRDLSDSVFQIKLCHLLHFFKQPRPLMNRFRNNRLLTFVYQLYLHWQLGSPLSTEWWIISAAYKVTQQRILLIRKARSAYKRNATVINTGEAFHILPYSVRDVKPASIKMFKNYKYWCPPKYYKWCSSENPTRLKC